ncbi:MAG: tetratricopeptide repeat protein, partial [Nodosilinea sp.]
YDLYTVTGQAGQTLAITLESLDLNTFLIVNDGQGNELARNNDIDTAAGNYHSFAVVTLPQGGEVRIVVKGFKVSARGRYRLRVQSADGTAQPQLSEAALMWVEANRLLEQGAQQFGLSQWREALQSYEQALVIYRDIKSRTGEARTLNVIGLVNRSQGNYSAALGYCEQALAITRDIKNRALEALTLRNIGLVNLSLGDYGAALDYYDQSLAIFRDLKDRAEEAFALRNIGIANWSRGDYGAALGSYEQALAIYRDLKDRAGEASVLLDIGNTNWVRGDYGAALDYYEQALAIYRDLKDRDGEASALSNIGKVQNALGDYGAELSYSEQALAIYRDLKDRGSEALTLLDMGNTNMMLGNFGALLGYYEQALAIYRDIGDRAVEALTLDKIGAMNNLLGNDRAALGYFNQSLAIARDIGNRALEAQTLNSIGTVQVDLGDYGAALDYYTQSLAIARDIGNRAFEAQTLNSIGDVQVDLGDYGAALDYYTQSLAIYRDIKDRRSEALPLMGIGNVQQALGDYRAALGYYDQSLAIARDIGDRNGEALTLHFIGTVQVYLRDYRAALGYFEQDLAIYRDLENRTGEALALGGIGLAYAAQSQPELAILFLKQAVTTYEAIRKDNQPLSSDLQAAYTTTVAGTYRNLADLLLQQDRIFEAQEVLDLLKVQELNDYLRGVRGETAHPLTILRPEEEILRRYGELQTQAAAIAQELAQLRQLDPTGRTPAQNQRIDTLVQLQQEMTEQFNAFVDSDDIQTLVGQLSRTAQRQSLNLEDLAALQDDLTALKGAILYPLILEDRLELVITIPNNPPLRRTVKVDRVTLNHAITDFRQVLDNPDHDPKPAAQTLYNYLIRPLEADLAAAGIETIIYAPDGPLRYVPLAALHDGNQWLIENYRVNNITARSLQDLDKDPNPIVDVLAGAFADQSLSYTIPVGRRSQTFQGLPFAGQEVAQLATTLTTTALFDSQFTWAAIRPKMNEFTVVHFATHAAFVPGQPEDSFILFGSGEAPTLADIKTWNLANVDLVVLSACETGLGGVEGNGEEILGLGYQFQQAGARAVIASLWQVDDGGTQALINAFYRALRQGYSKVEALQRAQQALINDDLSFVGEPRGTTIRVVDARTGQPITLRGQSDHPYYWAPFILIGNGL